MLRLATMLNNASRFAEAEPPLRKALALNDSSWRGYFELTRTLIGQKRLAEAVGSAAKARDLKPDNPQTYLMLYNLHIQADDYASALRDADGYLKLVPSGLTADRVRRMREQVQKALQALQVAQTPPTPTPQNKGGASLSITLRLEDDFPFIGMVDFHVKGASGYERSGKRVAGAASAAFFSGLPPGSYLLEVAAPGFETARQNIEIGPEQTEASVTLTMKQEVSAKKDVSSTEAKSPRSRKSTVIPRDVDAVAPQVATNTPCSLLSVLQGAGQRAEQLVKSLQRFSASERVEHFKLTAAGMPGRAEVRSFDYVVLISQRPRGEFDLEEYRNGSVVGPQQFPAGIATEKLPVHALIFHPSVAPAFNFTCEGLGQWDGRPTWVVHFEQKEDQPNRFRNYIVGGTAYPVLLKGRAWIDAGTYQILRLESDLIKPVEEIHLVRDHVSIEYGLVQFRTDNQQLWLPRSAEVYVALGDDRFFRRHTFSDFRIFMTGTAQELRGPEESFCLSNTSKHDVVGVLSANPIPGTAGRQASVTITIPAEGTVCKTVGPGKDLNIPLESLGSATFAHTGPPGSVQGDAYLVKESTLDIIPDSSIPIVPNH